MALDKRIKQGMAVYDAWWPIMRGVVERVGATRVRVKWMNGRVWSYDRPHQQFLRPLHR